MIEQIIEQLKEKGLNNDKIKDIMNFVEKHNIENEITNIQIVDFLKEKGLKDDSDEGIKKFIKENGLEEAVEELKSGALKQETKKYIDLVVVVYEKALIYDGLYPNAYKVDTTDILGVDPIAVSFNHKGTNDEIKGFIKTISSFDEFADIINVFKLPPYAEPLTVVDKMEEFEAYINGGLAIACYNDKGQIMGYAGLMNEVEDEHKPYFHEGITNLNNLYIYGLATHPEYRGFGICSELVELINEAATPLGMDFIYLRINHKDSMSEGLCRKKGYGDLYQDGKVVFQDISDQAFRISGATDPEGNLKRFLIMPVTENGKEFLVATGSIPGDLDVLTSEPKKLVLE